MEKNWKNELKIYNALSGEKELFKPLSGEFVGMTVDNPDCRIELKTFHCEIINDHEKIKKETGILTGAVGLITEAQQAEEILNNGQADLILFARESLRNPNMPLDFARELNDDIEWPKQYERAKL